jgi:hypothetical protein
VVNRVLTVSGKPVTVVGVAPQAFRGLGLDGAPDLYLPLNTIGDVGNASANYFAVPNHPSSPSAWVVMVGRLRAGMSAKEAESRLGPLLGARQGMTAPVATPIKTAAIPQAARVGMRHIADALRWRAGATAPTRARRLRTLLVTGQVAVAMVLLGGAVLFARSVAAALTLNPGFETTRILTGSVGLRPDLYTADRATGFFEDLRARLAPNGAIRSLARISYQGG